MEMQNNDTPRAVNPRRRKRSKFQIFKESYLPVIIVVLTICCLFVFILGSLSKNLGNDGASNEATTAPTTTTPTTSTLSQQLLLEADGLLSQAAVLAADYDYAGAMALLETFSGNIDTHPALRSAHDEYKALHESMVAWAPSQVVNLSIHMLIADPQRAFHDGDYGTLGDINYSTSYKKNFITTNEFSAILQQLYDNGYMLVSLSDLYTQEYDASSGRMVYVEKTLLLPPGKTPVMLTETNANYYVYMVDSSWDNLPDENGDGFAYKLCYGENGFYNEMINADGTLSTGAYDVVPILENFISAHPDFSYRGARAIIAMTGYDGVLGYRITSTRMSANALEAEKASAAAVVQALRDHGYEIACFTFDNLNYAEESAEKIKADLDSWKAITDVIGPVDIMVLPKEGDIATRDEEYNQNAKFNVMYNYGFTFYLGSGETPWSQVSDRYVRHSRLMVTGSYLLNHPEWYQGLFSAASVLDAARVENN